MVEDDAGHESTKKNREAMYAFFQKHLDNPGSNVDLETELIPVEDLNVTETGQLSTSVGSKFLYDINLDLAQKNIEKLQKSRLSVENHISSVKAKSGELSGYVSDENSGKLVFSGRSELPGIFMDKYIIELPEGQVLPFICFRPKESVKKLVLYLDDMKDKKDEKHFEIPIALAETGNMVLVPDLPGYGELGPGYLKGDAYFASTSYNQWFAGIINGKSMVAIHAEAIQQILEQFNNVSDLPTAGLVGISVGPFCSSLLHAATFGVELDEIILIEPLISISSLTTSKDYEPVYVPFTVAGGSAFYDLPDMIMAFSPKKIVLLNPKDGNGKNADTGQIEKEYDFAKSYYTSKGLSGNFQIKQNVSADSFIEIILKSFDH